MGAAGAYVVGIVSNRDEDSARGDGFTVNDRRWWASPESGAGAGPATEPELTSEPEATPEAETETADTRVDGRLIEYLQEQIHDRDRKIAAALDRQRLALAELDRTRERLERDAERQLELTRRDLVRGLLDLLDDLERAIAASDESRKDPALLDGVSLVARRFGSKLAELGVTADDPMGQRFDPIHHDAVSLVPVPDASLDGTVVGVIKKGYRIGDESLRPALVAVGKAAS